MVILFGLDDLHVGVDITTVLKKIFGIKFMGRLDE